MEMCEMLIEFFNARLFSISPASQKKVAHVIISIPYFSSGS